MYRLTWMSKGAMMAQQNKLDSISNNMANSTTTGYKKVNVGFSDLLQDSLDRRGYPIIDRSNDHLEHSAGVKSTQWVRDNTQGNLLQTGRKTDLALDGEGYFEVTKANGEKAYTRDGSFFLDRNGDLVNSNGNYVTITQNGREIKLSQLNLPISQDNLVISEDGEVQIYNDQKFTTVGKIKVTSFVGNNALNSIGDNLYVPKEGAQSYESKDFSIRSGYLEQSNVDLGEEMTELIIAQRAFQLSSNALKTADEMWGMVNNLRGR